MLERISENLSEAMQNKVAFRIPIFGGIPVPVSCVVTWIIMAILVIASILLTRNLKQNNYRIRRPVPHCYQPAKYRSFLSDDHGKAFAGNR